MAPYMYKFIPVARRSEGTDSTGYPPWLYGLGKIYLQRKRVQLSLIHIYVGILPAVITAGIHYDNLSRDEIVTVTHLTDDLLAQVLTFLNR